MKIAYIGLKEQKGDNIAQTGLIWKRGEVHDIADEKKAAKLLEHPLIWQNVTGKEASEITAMLIPELAVIPPEPRIQVMPKDAPSPYWEPIITVVPEDVFKKIQSKELVQVFMTKEDADSFTDWKLERDTRPDAKDIAPKNTGPKPQPKETRAGLEKKSA